jgi:SAM-dependent methyltransferase
MYAIKRSLRFMRNAIANYGPPIVKKTLWDREYSVGQWNFNDHTASDPLYPHLARHAKNGSILDIGCGSGNTANELAANAYLVYLGVDISEAALDKARHRTEQNGRTDKVRFLVADFLRYVPTQQFDVILFRHSLYMVPLTKVKTTLDRYSKYLKDGGVFVVSISTTEKGQRKHRPTTMVRTIETGFDIVDKRQYDESSADGSRSLNAGSKLTVVIVFRPKCSAGSKGIPSK